MRCLTTLIVALTWVAAFPRVATADEFPPGWLPLNCLDDSIAWADFRKTDDKIRLYLPPHEKTVRGVFVCFVFHSADPRELARLWRFALVTVPWPFEYDLGHNDKRNGRYKLGHPTGDMSLLLRYLDRAAVETKHPELGVAPLVGWLGQNGSHLCADLYRRAPDRVLAWADSFPNRLAQQPQLTAAIPFVYAWELSSGDEKEHKALRDDRLPQIEKEFTPPKDFACRANTYGFPHGIYSKFNFFAAYLARCIALRLPDETPPPGTATKLRPLELLSGWAGDYNEIGQWNTIAPCKDATGMVEPTWLPDAYAAWMWRSYHSAQPDLKLTAPVIEYRKANGKWGGPECGLGYGGQVPAGTSLKFAATAAAGYQKVEFHDGDRVVGTATTTPWEIDGIKFERGLHVLFAVGTKPDGSRAASRCGFLIVE